MLKSVYSAISYQPFHTDWITKVSIIGQNGAIQGQAGNTSGDDFYISDNKLAWGLSNVSLAAQAILNEVQGARYTPADIDAMGLPYLECGDIILANTRRNVITTYILERTLKGIQALTDVFGSDSDQARPPYVPTVQAGIDANALAAENAHDRADDAYNYAGNAKGKADSAYTYAGEADGHAKDAKDRADSAYNLAALKVTAKEVETAILNAGYASVGDLKAAEGRIGSLETTVASINKAYIDEAECKKIASNQISAYWANITEISVGRVIAGEYRLSGSSTSYTKQQWNVRLANGKTQLITYLGST